MIRMPPKPSFDVMRPGPGIPTLGEGAAAGALPKGTTPASFLKERFEVADAVSKVQTILDQELPPDRAKILEAIDEKLGGNIATRRRRQHAGIERGISEIEDERAFQRAALELMRWQKEGLKLERPRNSVMHHLLDSMAEKRVRLLFKEAAGIPGDFSPGHLVGQGTHAFLMEHDWAGVFDGAAEFDGDDFRLPFDSMCFEFRISGKNVCVMVTHNGERKILVPFVETDGGWALPQFAYTQTGTSAWKPTSSHAKPGDDSFELLRKLLCDQIRAACISLDAEVTTTEVVRASYRLNRSREKNRRAPIADYHVIKLAHRHRALPRPDDGDPGTRKRLHFRRGHWRHYSNHRTWIRWTLCGDYDLGFIDKHYRL